MISVPRSFGRWMMGCALGAATWLTANPAMTAEFALSPGNKAVGGIQEYVIQQGDLLADVARKFDVGYTEILAANPGIEPWLPPVGRKIVIPTLFILPDAPRQGIVLNLGERRLYYFPPGGGPRGNTVVTYPIGIGATGFDTPHSVTRVVAKVAGPTWVPPPSIRAEQPDLPAAIGPGPDNPLGAYEFRLGWKNYLIHGTNKPDGVGRNVSHGCIHLYPEDIEQLFGMAAIGIPVRVIDQEGTAAWVDDKLYIAVHPSKLQADEIDVQQPMTPEPLAGWRERVAAVAGDYAQAADWAAVDQAAARRSGLPVVVATGRPSQVEMSVAPPAPAAAPQPMPMAQPVAQGLTPIFNTLQPPQSGLAGPTRSAPPPAVAGVPLAPPSAATNTKLAPPTALWPQAAPDAPLSPPIPGAEDPNAAYNATFTAPTRYDPGPDLDRAAWEHGYR